MDVVSRKAKFFVGVAALTLTYPIVNSVIQPNYVNPKSDKDWSDRTVIVTGASGNLGAAIVTKLAFQKARVIMACRDLDKCRAIRREIVIHTNHKGLACRHLNLEDIDSINSFADDMIANEPHIDVLINNAAVKNIPKKELTKYGIEKNYFVNFLGPYLLTFRLLDKLKEASKITRDSRIINVIGTPRKSWHLDLSDINFDKRAYDSKSAYRQSKLALAYFTILLNDFNRKEKNFVYVFGTSPIYRTFFASLYKPMKMNEQITMFIKQYTEGNPMTAAGPVVNCALNPSYNYSKSGKLFTFFGVSWGWGAAEKDMNKAKAVWNAAAQTILDVSESKQKTSLK